MPTTRIRATPERAPEGAALYVHTPFCAAKCHYCDFFSLPDAGQDVDGAVEALLREAAVRAPRRPRTLFLGGGTPSLLDERQLARLLDGLDALTDFRASALEVSAECNPESLDASKARALVALGVRRLSIGFQSLSDEVLRLFGRVHSAADSFRAYEAARAAGPDSVNVDLIYAIPGQSAEQWERDLERILDLEPDHLSAYNLTFEEDTRFRRWLDSGRLARAPEETELAMLHATRAGCARRGLPPYEISNHARPGRECLHNLVYWHNGEYVGLGPSAVSQVGGTRRGNVRALGAWRRRIERAGAAEEWSETLDPRARLAETWWLGLRLARGLSPAEARERAGYELAPGEEDPAVPVARALERSGHLERDGERWRLSPLGLPLADALAAEFLRRLGAGAGAA